MSSEAETSIKVRPYIDADYDQVLSLIKRPQLYGGEFSVERDSRERLNNRIIEDPESIWVAADDGKIVGTISLILDARVAWLYRFIVEPANLTASQSLVATASAVARKRGHKEVLVYSNPKNQALVERYQKLGFNEGGTYVCYWINT